MKDRLFPQLRFVTLTEHIVNPDLISLDPITSSRMDAEAFLLLDPLALLVSLEEPYSSVCPDPKSYPWLLEARQVHIALLLVVMVENITDDVLKEIIPTHFGNGAGSLKVGWFGMLASETASEGTEDVIVIVDVELGLTLLRTLKTRPEIIELLIQMVIESALDILPRLSRVRLKAIVPLGYAEVLDRCGGGRPVSPDRVVSRTTRVVVEDKDAIHVVLIVMSPDCGLPAESPWLDLYVRSRLNVDGIVVAYGGRQPTSIPGYVHCAGGSGIGGLCCVRCEAVAASCAYEWDWMITCHFASSEAKDVSYKTLPETHPPTV